MFWALLRPSSGARDYSADLPHGPSGSWVAVCWKLVAGRLDECPACKAIACSLDLPASNFQQHPKNWMAHVVNQHYSHELLMMGIAVPETC